MIHRVELTNDLGQGMHVSHHFESMTDNVQSAVEFGEECAHLMVAFNQGFGEARPNAD